MLPRWSLHKLNAGHIPHRLIGQCPYRVDDGLVRVVLREQAGAVGDPVLHEADEDRIAIGVAILGIVGVALAWLFLLPPLFDSWLALGDTERIMLALLLVAPLALFMGMPFPLGMARLAAAGPGLIPWAWGINGCASVISAILAALLAIQFGFMVVLLAALLLYAVAALSFP